MAIDYTKTSLEDMVTAFACDAAMSAFRHARFMLEMIREFPDHYDIDDGCDTMARYVQSLSRWTKKIEKYQAEYA